MRRREHDDPRGVDLLHLRRDRRPRRHDERLLRRGHALPLAARAAHQRRPAAPALVGEGRVLLGRLLPAQPGRGRARPGLALDRTRAVRRRRDAGPLVVRNESFEPLTLELELEVGTDFADIISVKEHDFALGNPCTRGRCRRRPPSATTTANQLVLEESGDGSAKTQVLFSQRGGGRRLVRPLRARARPARALGSAHRRRRLAQRARSRSRSPSSSASARSASTCRSRSRPGTCACRGSAEPRRPRPRVRAVGRRPRRAAHARPTASGCCPRPGCPGS